MDTSVSRELPVEGVATDLGTVLGSTLGWATEDDADDSEYFKGAPAKS
ncbi:hypothetical protein [Streptomyces spiramenti]|uniref:Uncharacterized protein n=1 Tax=Streptomyces spiramenti TaxID=2720606 RepID=A0ABX1AJZ1_9ACTN|nr:hypothetical protein [Streptomyces spiramenti]NJP66316.1 hypothetical protein [Streptomyces spiramenti]